MNFQRNRLFIAGALLLLIAVVAAGFLGGWDKWMQTNELPEVAVSVSAATVDPLNEARLVSVQGKLEFAAPPTDVDLGVVAADAVVLVRNVEMYQWQESCLVDSCTQTPVWSAQWIDSSQFHEQLGHNNPDHFPIESARFFATGIHLGAYSPELELIMAEVKPVGRPLHPSDLPANLAGSFSEYHGRIYAGDDPLRPSVGDLRISHEIVPVGVVTLTGIQSSVRLLAAHSASSN